MQRVVTFGLIAVSGIALSACGLGSKTAEIEVTKELVEIVQAERAEAIPSWYINTPEDREDMIFGSGTGLSTDLQFSMDKAMHQAKVVLGDKINNTVSMEMKTYTADNSATGGLTVEETQKVSKSGYKVVDVSEYDVIEKAVTLEGINFRTYVLLKVDPSGRKNTAPIVTQSEIDDVQSKARQAMDDL